MSQDVKFNVFWGSFLVLLATTGLLACSSVPYGAQSEITIAVSSPTNELPAITATATSTVNTISRTISKLEHTPTLSTTRTSVIPTPSAINTAILTPTASLSPTTSPPTATALPLVTPIAENAIGCKAEYPSIGGVISGTLGVERGLWDVYCVKEDLLVPLGKTLTLYEGTTLVFAPGKQLIVAGRLIGKGNSVFPVRLMSTVEAGWEGVHFLPSAQPSECGGCYLENLATNATGLEVEAPLTFKYGLIRDVPGGVAISSTVSITLSNLLIDYVGTGLHLSKQPTGQSTATHLTLSRCGKGVVNRGQMLALDNSIITYCGEAVSTLSGTTELGYSLFYNNMQDFHVEPGAQLIKGQGLLLNQDPAFVDFPDNFHLKPDSPAVDAADPSADYRYEVGFNGGRADLGCYGNTPQATERIPYEQMAFTLSSEATVLKGQPGETLTYTLSLKNTGSLTDTYFMSGKMSRSREFGLKGLGYTFDTDSYHDILTVAPQKERHKKIEIKIPTYATNGMVNITSLKASGFYTGHASLDLTTAVSVPTSIELVGHIGGLEPQQVFIQDTYAYIAAGSDGLQIVDIAQPGQPVDLGRYELLDITGKYVQSVAVAGQYAYLAAGEGGVRVVDVSDPATPFEVGSYEGTGLAQKLVVADDYIYVIWDECHYYYFCPNDYLQIMDISDPASPTEVAIYHSPGRIKDIKIANDYLYLAVGNGLRVLDITHPTAPIEVGLFDQANTYYQNAEEVFLNNQYAYIATGNGGLRVVDISDPTTPIEINTYKEAGYISDVAVVGNYAYVGSQRNELHVLDISNPEAVYQVGLYKSTSDILNVTLIGSYLYLGTRSSGLQVLDISEPSQLYRVDSYGGPANVQDVAVTGQYAYVADGYDGLYIVDVSDPARPIRMGLYDRHGGAWEVDVVSHYVYAMLGECDSSNYYGRHYGNCNTSLHVLDVSIPSNPVEVAVYGSEADIEMSLGGLEILGNYAYLSDQVSSQLHVLDVSNPAAPTKVDSLNMQVGHFVLANGYLYTLSPYNYTYIQGGGITSTTNLDILDANSLERIGSYQLPEQYPGVEVVVMGTLTYIYWDVPCLSGCTFDGWLTVDVSNPAAPVKIDASYQFLRPQSAVTANDHVYLAMGKAGLHIFDISDPSRPIHIDAFGEPSFAFDVAVADSYVYLANGSGGLFILRYPEAE